jgi:hypothetical protein
MHGPLNLKVLPTCFGFYKAIIRDAVYTGIETQQIMSKICMCGVKILSIKTANNV